MAQPDTKPPLPPFTLETAKIKVKAAQNAWNTKDPHTIKNAYTPDSIWRNRDQFLQGTDTIVAFLTDKWSKENGYRLRKELFAFTDDKVCFLTQTSQQTLIDIQIAVQFWYEWHDGDGQWWRTYGLEDWTFATDGRMRKRQMSGNDVKIADEERWFANGVNVDEVEILEKHW
jgi:nuclear transport factor 2 (NTF2) superfamily protein